MPPAIVSAVKETAEFTMPDHLSGKGGRVRPTFADLSP